MDKLDKNKIDELLPRYCEGQVTEEERLLVEAWMNESEENRRVAKQIHSLYLATDTIHVMKKVDTEKALSRVKGRITGRKKTMWWEWAQRAAAVLFIPLLVVQLVHYWGGDEQELAQMLEVKTNPGMTTSLTLSDGTVVFLNSESRLTYPSHFNGDTRNVTLQGEAYFEVSKDPKHPFIVQTETIDVQVLGTHFNVDAYQNNPDVKTTLLTGSVAVSNKSNSVRMILKPNEIAIYNKVGNKLTRQVTKNAKDEISWRDGEFIFDNLPLGEIARELSNSFDTPIHIADTSLQSYRISARFRNGEDLETILSVLHHAGYFNYSQNNKQIVITTKPDLK